LNARDEKTQDWGVFPSALTGPKPDQSTPEPGREKGKWLEKKKKNFGHRSSWGKSRVTISEAVCQGKQGAERIG